jgi:hypothetical protein
MFFVVFSIILEMSVSELRQIGTGCSPQRPAYILGNFSCVLWWTKWHWSKISSEFFGCPLLFILPSLHTHLSQPCEVCDNPDQAKQDIIIPSVLS